MVLDTSAVMAILQQEAEAADFAHKIESATTRLISTGTVLEAGIIAASRRGRSGAGEFENFLLRGRIEVIPFDVEQAEIAREAYQKFGRGRGPANLNFGDCFSYALSKASGEPLLYKGSDFGLTNIIPA